MLSESLPECYRDRAISSSHTQGLGASFTRALENSKQELREVGGLPQDAQLGSGEGTSVPYPVL